MKFFIGATQIETAIGHLVVAGWTGRDHSTVQHHIDELAKIGVAPPSSCSVPASGGSDLR